MKKIYHLKHFNIPFYRGYLVVILTDDTERINKMLSVNFENIYGYTIYDAYRGQQGFFIVLNPNSSFRNMTHGTIAHEAYHAAGFIAIRRGITADFDNDEPLAYLADWITDKVYETFNHFKLLSSIKLK